MEDGEVLVPKPCKKVPVKNANATNLKGLQMHHPPQYTKLFFDVQKEFKLLLFMKMHSTECI